MWRSDVVEVLGGSRESHDVDRFIHHSSSIKLTRALPPIQHFEHDGPPFIEVKLVVLGSVKVGPYAGNHLLEIVPSGRQMVLEEF
jgi:hypothetical protein